jgi:hypothetical protein
MCTKLGDHCVAGSLIITRCLEKKMIIWVRDERWDSLIIMLGYKGFNQDLTCQNFQYEIGKTYKMDSDQIQLCKSGFHFCQYPVDILNYYNKCTDQYALIQAKGTIISDDYKSVTNRITVIKLLTYEELLSSMPSEIIRPSGIKEFYQNGLLHRLDGPSIEHPNGAQFWYQNGKLHRLNGPAKEKFDGQKEWYQNGQLHRLDGPAIEKPNGDQYWYLNDQLHRSNTDLNGPSLPAIEFGGSKHWYQNGQRHRLDGPAVETFTGHKEWYQNGKLHRKDGPAIEYVDECEKWYQENKLHRLGGPAIEYSNGDKKWYENGELVRESVSSIGATV